MADDNNQIIIQFFLPSQSLMQIKKVINQFFQPKKYMMAQPDKLGQSTDQQTILFGYTGTIHIMLDCSLTI
jgi:hypothetical protein